jgi:hypothetical protein
MKIKKLISEKFEERTPDQQLILDYIDELIIEQNLEFKSNKSSGKITFGKYKGYTIKEVLKTPDNKGLHYIQWLMIQSWFSEDKFEDLYKQIKDAKIKKKVLDE